MPKLLRALSSPLIIIVTLLIAGIITNLLFRKRKEKIPSIKERIERKTHEQKDWSTPLFNNPAFYVGGFLLFIFGFLGGACWAVSPNEGCGTKLVITSYIFIIIAFPLLVSFFITSIRITERYIELQPLLFRLFHLKLFLKIIYYNNIKNIQKIKVIPPWLVIEIDTRDSKKLKLNTGGYEPEIGYAIYEFLEESLKDIGDRVK